MERILDEINNPKRKSKRNLIDFSAFYAENLDKKRLYLLSKYSQGLRSDENRLENSFSDESTTDYKNKGADNPDSATTPEDSGSSELSVKTPIKNTNQKEHCFTSNRNFGGIRQSGENLNSMKHLKHTFHFQLKNPTLSCAIKYSSRILISNLISARTISRTKNSIISDLLHLYFLFKIPK